MKTVYASPRLLFLSSEMKWILSAPRFAFSKHRCEEPLVWTVIPLLKPWAEPYSNTPDAISNSTCAKKKKKNVFLHSQITTVLDVQLSFRDASETLRWCWQNVVIFWRSFRLFQCWMNSRGGSVPPSGWRSLAHSLHMHLTWNSTQLDSLRVLQEGEGEGRVCGQCKVVNFFCSWPGFYIRRVSLSAECLSATCNLKDCSNDALELCTNYAKWPNQLLFPSSAWCACLWMHCPIPFCLFLFLGCCEEQLRLSLFFFFFFCTETKMVKWLFEHSIYVFGLSTLILYSGTNCVWV